MASRYMSVFIETLTGVAFELTCSPLDTVFIIKRKIYILEDIPVQQQHLVFRGRELCDPLTLLYYGICSGTTIKLVIGMQVGPANSKKAEHEMLIDLAHFVHHFREQPGYDGVDPIVIASEDSMQFFFPEVEVENVFDDLPYINEVPSESVGVITLSEEEEENRREENKILKQKMKTLLVQLKNSRMEKENRNALMNPDKEVSKRCAITGNIEDALAQKLTCLTLTGVTEYPASSSEVSSASSHDFVKFEMSNEKHGAISKLPSIEAKKKKRCSWCKKKIGLTTTYTCRCGKDFCGPHRYAETHECTYDYRAEGQKTVLKNSAIRAPKLPKI